MALDPTKYQADASAVKVESNNPPFLRIIQKGSAEFDKTHKQYKDKGISGCDVGDILHTTLGKILPRPLRVIPLRSQTVYAEWRPKKAGGGFVAHHPLTIVADKAYQKKDKKEFIGENELLLTIYYFVLIEIEGKLEKCVIPFTGTGLKHARRWAKVINSHTDDTFKKEAPAYACVYTVTTAPESNDSGSWMGWSIEKLQPIAALPEAEAESVLEVAFKAAAEAKQSAQAALPAGPAHVEEDAPY